MPIVVRSIVIVLVLSGLFVGIGSLRKGQVERALTLQTTAALLREVPELRDEPEWEVSFLSNEGIVHGRIGSRGLLEKTAAAIARIERAEVAGLEAVSRLYNGLQFREPATLSVYTLSSGTVCAEGKLSAPFVEQLRHALSAALPVGVQLDDRLQVHRELTSIPWGKAILSYLPEFLREAGGCRLSVADNRVTLGGIVPSEGEKQRLDALTLSHLGDAFSYFDNRLGVTTNRRPSAIAIHFVAPEIVRVSGTLPSSAAKDSLMASLAAVMPKRSIVKDDLQIDRSAEHGGWYNRVPEVLPKLFRYAMTADVAIAGNQVKTSAKAISERGRKEIGDMMAGLFPASEYQVTCNIILAEGGNLRAIAAPSKPVPAAPMVRVSMPSPELFQPGRELRKIAGETIIYFEINSAMLGDANITTLNRVAKTLAAAGPARIVLRGFTDQRGDARLNRELASFRCRSVRKLLLMRGVKEELVRIEPWSEELVSAGRDEPGWKKRRVEFGLEPVSAATSAPAAGRAEKFEIRRPDLAGAPAESLAGQSATAAQPRALRDSAIYFGNNSYAVRRSERAKLASVNRVLANAPGKRVVISGFCDKWGNAEYNLFLSRKRCEAAREYLLRLGVAPERMVVEDNGNEGAADEAGPGWRKRRVEFRLEDAPHLGVADACATVLSV